MEIPKPKIESIYPKDIIALVCLIGCFILMYLGINHVVSGIAIMIVTYYFSKRIYEEKHPNGDIKKQVEKLESEVQQIPKASQIPSPSHPSPFEPGEVVVKPPISS